MSEFSDITRVTTARKDHWCSWCNEKIDKGSSYNKWTWSDSGDVGGVKIHPECLAALKETMQTEGSPYEFAAGDNPRGCLCGFEKNCKRCAEIKQSSSLPITPTGMERK